MHTNTSKTTEHKNLAVANNIHKPQNTKKSAFQFVDNRPEAMAQLKLQDMVNNSARMQQMNVYQKMADNFVAQKEDKENKTGLPDHLKSGIENLSGYSMKDVKVHYNSSKPAQLKAHAYAQGSDIHLASGQEKHLPHEAWHVVQQKQGRVVPTRQMKEGTGNPNRSHVAHQKMVDNSAMIQPKWMYTSVVEYLNDDSWVQIANGVFKNHSNNETYDAHTQTHIVNGREEIVNDTYHELLMEEINQKPVTNSFDAYVEDDKGIVYDFKERILETYKGVLIKEMDEEGHRKMMLNIMQDDLPNSRAELISWLDGKPDIIGLLPVIGSGGFGIVHQLGIDDLAVKIPLGTIGEPNAQLREEVNGLRKIQKSGFPTAYITFLKWKNEDGAEREAILQTIVGGMLNKELFQTGKFADKPVDKKVSDGYKKNSAETLKDLKLLKNQLSQNRIKANDWVNSLDTKEAAKWSSKKISKSDNEAILDIQDLQYIIDKGTGKLTLIDPARVDSLSDFWKVYERKGITGKKLLKGIKQDIKDYSKSGIERVDGEINKLNKL